MFEWLRKIRKYANFFEAPSKEIKEFTVAKEWLKTLAPCEYNGGTLVPVSDQWPDCEINLYSGETCGIEITELVCSKAIKENASGYDVYRAWNESDILAAIDERLQMKNIKTHGGKYKKLIVLLHTDEMDITYDRRRTIIESHEFKNLSNIDEAYLVYSYDPNYKKYPVSKLITKARVGRNRETGSAE